jgi:hypothetical protein
VVASVCCIQDTGCWGVRACCCCAVWRMGDSVALWAGSKSMRL